MTKSRIRSPNVPKQNVTIIEAMIDSVITGEGDNLRIMLTVLSAIPEEDIDSYADVGQRLIVAPEYYRREGGTVDGKNERNEKLMALRAAKTGDIIKAKITLGHKGDWNIIEVLE